MRSRTQRETNHSNTLDNDAVREMGLISDVISLGGFCLGKGTTLASFHPRGTYPSQREALKMAVKGSANQTENSRRNQLGSWSGPQDLRTSILLSLLSTDTGI